MHNIDDMVLFYGCTYYSRSITCSHFIFFPLRVIEIQQYRKLRAHNNTKLYLPIYVYNMYICIYNTGYYTLLLYMGVGWLEDIHIYEKTVLVIYDI